MVESNTLYLVIKEFNSKKGYLGADKVSAAVLSGDVEVGFAGPESAIYVYENGEKVEITYKIINNSIFK